MSLIEKIDAEMKLYEASLDGGEITGIYEGLRIAKEIILSEQKEPLTIGDKIRESNESLAEYLFEKYLSVSSIPRQDSMRLVMSYLNQPSTDET